jgi:hypothetical protein
MLSKQRVEIHHGTSGNAAGQETLSPEVAAWEIFDLDLSSSKHYSISSVAAYGRHDKLLHGMLEGLHEFGKQQ